MNIQHLNQRILIIGCAGAGKSTLARRLSQKTALPLLHLDHLFWKPGWVQRDPNEFSDLLEKEMSKDRWIIDGNYGRTLTDRIKTADTVIFLDFNRWICTWRVFKRWLFKEGFQAKGCPQKIDFEFMIYVFFTFRRVNRNRILKLRQEHKEDLNWITLSTQKDVDNWFKTLF